MIRINKLNKYYDKGKVNETHIIDDVSLEFEDKGLICILGESGSGKTTLLNTLGGLDSFQSGNIVIDDAEINRYDENKIEKQRNHKFAYIFQNYNLINDQTVAYNIELTLNPYDLSEEEKQARIDYVLHAVDMKKYKKRYVSQLSGGQQQRIAIARALVKSPEVIFADEPTGNLDEANTLRIMSIIKKISRDCLVIMVTHEKRIAEFFADRIIYYKNGKVVGESLQEGEKSYQYRDDTNLYLKEYEKETIDHNQIRINLYNEDKNKDIILNMIYENGKLLIQTPNEEDVVFLAPGDEKKIIDDFRPEIKQEQIEEFEYKLSPIGKSTRASLSFKECWNLAYDNILRLRRKQMLLIFMLLIISVLLVVATADYTTVSSVDKKSFITTNSHYVEITGKRNSYANNDEYLNSFVQEYGNLVNTNLTQDRYICLDVNLSLMYQGYGQMKKLSYSFRDFSFVTLDHLKEEDLVYGRMPVKRNEIVVDQWLIDVFEDSDCIFKSLMKDTASFLNQTVVTGASEQELVIVGICNRGEPTVYIDKYMGISAASWADKVASLQQLQAEYPGQYDKISLSETKVLVSETVDQKLKMKGEERFTAQNGQEFEIAGTFSDEFGAAYVIDDLYYKNILNEYIATSRRFMIYTTDKTAIMDYFNQNLGGFHTEFFKFVATDHYANQMKEYASSSSATVNARNVITVILFILALFILYYTMKSKALNSMKQLKVYRLLGISKRRIIFVFILETMMVTSFTALPTVLLVSGIIKLLETAPVFHIVYPWSAAVLILTFLYLVIILVGILPVYHIIKHPPAKIAERV